MYCELLIPARTEQMYGYAQLRIKAEGKSGKIFRNSICTENYQIVTKVAVLLRVKW
jgi:hypothetical protein